MQTQCSFGSAGASTHRDNTAVFCADSIRADAVRAKSSIGDTPKPVLWYMICTAPVSLPPAEGSVTVMFARPAVPGAALFAVGRCEQPVRVATVHVVLVCPQRATGQQRLVVRHRAGDGEDAGLLEYLNRTQATD